MMKLTGTLLIVCSTSLWGIKASMHIQNQYTQMRYLQRLLYSLRSEIQYTRAYLGEAFVHIGRTTAEPYRTWLLQMGRQMELRNGTLLYEIWEEHTGKWLKGAGLPPEELQKLKELGKSMGMADLEMQVKSLDLYLEELARSMSDLRPVIKNKIRLYHCLGVMSGLFLSILLI